MVLFDFQQRGSTTPGACTVGAQCMSGRGIASSSSIRADEVFVWNVGPPLSTLGERGSKLDCRAKPADAALRLGHVICFEILLLPAPEEAQAAALAPPAKGKAPPRFPQEGQERAAEEVVNQNLYLSMVWERRAAGWGVTALCRVLFVHCRAAHWCASRTTSG